MPTWVSFMIEFELYMILSPPQQCCEMYLSKVYSDLSKDLLSLNNMLYVMRSSKFSQKSNM